MWPNRTTNVCSVNGWPGANGPGSVDVNGNTATARLLIEDLRARPEIGIKPVACLDDDARKIGEARVCGYGLKRTLTIR